MSSQSACWVLGINLSQTFLGLNHTNSTSKGTTTTTKKRVSGIYGLEIKIFDGLLGVGELSYLHWLVKYDEP